MRAFRLDTKLGPEWMPHDVVDARQQGKSLSNLRVRAAAPEDGVAHSYFVFADGRLLPDRANLSEREVFIRDSGRRDDRGHKVYDERNDLDYFHSLLHVSPDSRHFLSNGWV